jgi:hypothetical protein
MAVDRAKVNANVESLKGFFGRLGAGQTAAQQAQGIAPAAATSPASVAQPAPGVPGQAMSPAEAAHIVQGGGAGVPAPAPPAAAPQGAPIFDYTVPSAAVSEAMGPPPPVRVNLEPGVHVAPEVRLSIGGKEVGNLVEHSQIAAIEAAMAEAAQANGEAAAATPAAAEAAPAAQAAAEAAPAGGGAGAPAAAQQAAAAAPLEAAPHRMGLGDRFLQRAGITPPNLKGAAAVAGPGAEKLAQLSDNTSSLAARAIQLLAKAPR